MKLEEVMAFLGREAEKGTLKGATATAMKAACSKIQDFLEERENNVEWLMDNLDTIFARVVNKDKSLNQASIHTYKSRALKALNLYKNFKADPLNWHKELRHRSHKNQNSTKEKRETKTSNEVPQPESTTSIADVLFPLRDDFDFKTKLPKDIKLNEMKRLFYHLITFAKDFDPAQNKADWFTGGGGRANPSREIE